MTRDEPMRPSDTHRTDEPGLHFRAIGVVMLLTMPIWLPIGHVLYRLWGWYNGE